MPTVKELDALDQVAAPASQPVPRGRRVTIQTLDSLDEAPGLLARAAGAVKGLFEAAVPNPAGLLTAAGKLTTPSPAPEVASQAEVRARPPGAFETATGFEAPTAIAPIPTPILPLPGPPPADILPAEEVGRRLAEQSVAERLLPESGVPTREAAAALEAPVPPASAALRAAGSVMVPPRTALETITQSKPLKAFGVGIGNSIEGLLAKALVPSLHGVGPKDYDPTLLDQAFETVGSLFTPLTVVTFIAGSAPGTIGVKKLAEVAVKRYGPEAVSGALKALGQQVAGAATSFASFNTVQDVLRQTGAVRAGEQKALQPGEIAKEAGKGLVTGAAMGLAGVPITSPLLRKAADIGVLATVPPLLEGRPPGTEDLLNAGVLVGTLAVAHRVTGQAAAALAKVRSARTPAEQAQVDAIPEPVRQEIIQEVVAKAQEAAPAEIQPPPEVLPKAAILPSGKIPAAVQVPPTFQKYVLSQGKAWPLTVVDPDFLRLRTEYDALRQPLYEKRGAEVVNKGTGEVVTTLPNGAAAQMEANRLNGARLRAPVTPPAEVAAPVKAELPPVVEVPAQAPPEAAPPPETALPGRIEPVAVGREQQIRVPAGRKYRVRYEIVDAESLIPSNNPQTFARTPGYPEGVQNRPYETDRAEQAKVVSQAQDFEPLFLVSPQPSSGGTPIIAPGANYVLSGNSRTMSLLRTLGTPKYDAYRQALGQIAPAVGITPEQIATVKNPVLVRRLLGEKDTPEFYRRFAKETNESFKQALSQEAAAVSQGQAVSPGTLDYIASQLDALGPEATLRQLFGSNRDREIVRRFIQDGVFTGRDVSRYVDARSGLLNDEGKRLVENSLLGSAVPDTMLLQVAPDQALSKIARSLGEIAKVRARGGEWDLSRPLTEALRELTESRAAGMPLDEFRRQQSLLEAEPKDPRSGRLADALIDMPPTRFRQAMGGYAADAIRDVAGQQAMRFAAPKGPDQAFAEAFGAWRVSPAPAIAPAGAPAGVAEPMPPFGVSPVAPKNERVLGEAGKPLPTSPTESMVEGAQPLGPQTSTQTLMPSEPSLARIPPTVTGLERSSSPSVSRKVGTLDSPTGLNIFQPSQDVKTLLAGASEMEPGLGIVLRSVADAVPGARFVGSRIKTEERALDKITSKRRPADTLPDYLGGRIAVDHAEDSQRVLEALNRQGGGVVFEENFVDSPRDGYRSRHVQVRLPNGMTAEIQITPSEIQEVQDRAHEHYKALRDPEASLADFRNAQAASKAIFDEAWGRYQARVAREPAPAAKPVTGESGLTPGSLILAGREFVARGRAALFGVGEKPPTYAVREGVKAPEARQLAFEALKDTEQVSRKVQSVAGKLEGGVRTLGVGITSDLVMKQRVDLRGRVVKTARDLAQLAQVYRDPRYETFRIFYVDADGKILGHEGVTSRLPGSSAGFEGPEIKLETMQMLVRGAMPERLLPRQFQEMRDRMTRLGANGYWLLHNHPSGSPLPSQSDGLFSQAFSHAVPGFRGHVVIDSGKFGMLTPTGKRSLGKLPGGADLLLRPALDSPFLGLLLHKGEQVAALGRRIQSPEGFVTLLYRDAAGRVRAVQEVPEGLFQRPDAMTDYLRGRQREFGGMDVLAYAKNPGEPTVAAARALIEKGSLLDLARAEGPTMANQVGQTRNPRATRGIRVEDRYFGLADQAREGFRVEEEKPPTPGREPEEIHPDVFRRLVEVGGAHYEEGAREFPAWSERMKADLGDPVEPYLPRVWDELQRERTRAATPAGEFVPPQGPAEPPRQPPELVEPRITTPTFKQAALAAEEAMRSVGIARDREAFPKISDQLIDVIDRGQATLEGLLPVLERHGLTIPDFLEQMFAPGRTEAGRTLQVLSAIERRFNLLEEQARRERTGEPPLTREEAKARLSEAGRLLRLAREVDEGVRLTSWWRRADNVRRGLLVSQLATAVRNFETQVGRLGLDVLDAGLQRQLQQMFGHAPTANPAEAMAALAETFRQFAPGEFRAKRDYTDEILKAYPREWNRLFGTYMSDMLSQARDQGVELKGTDLAWAHIEKTVGQVNVANRFQEYVVRRAVFQETLKGRLERRGLNLEDMVQHPPDFATKPLNKLTRDQALQGDAYVRDLKYAIDRALEITFASRPGYGTAGWDFVRLINKAPFLATGIIPFPRFMVNSIRFLYEFSPLGFGKLLNPAERAAFRAGDMRVISRATLGTAMFFSALGIRMLQGDDTKWYEVKMPNGGTIDIRPFNPFAAYFFAAEMARRLTSGKLYEKTSAAELISGILSVNVRAGLGLLALEKVMDGLREQNNMDKAVRTLMTGAGELFSGYLVPLLQLRDLFGQFDERFAMVRSTRTEPFTGAFKEKIPGAAEGLIPGIAPLEPRYLPTRAEPQQRQVPLARQLTGAILNPPKNAAERELDRFQFDLKEIQPSVGDPHADNLIAKHLGALVEERLVPYVESERYQRMPEGAQGNALRLRLKGLRAIAKARARREEPEVFKGLREERRPGRERLYRHERQLTREERQAAQAEPEAALVGAGTEEGQ